MKKEDEQCICANQSQTVICLMKNTTILKLDSFHQLPWCRHQQSDMANYYYYYSWSWCTLVRSSASNMRNCDGVHSTAIITHTLASPLYGRLVAWNGWELIGMLPLHWRVRFIWLHMAMQLTGHNRATAVALFVAISSSSTSSIQRPCPSIAGILWKSFNVHEH